MKKPSHMLNFATGLIWLVLGFFTFYVSRRYGGEPDYVRLVAYCLLGVSFMVPVADMTPAMPKGNVIRMILLFITVFLLGISFGRTF